MLFAQALIATTIHTGTLLASTSSLSGSSNKGGLRSCTLEQAAVKTETVASKSIDQTVQVKQSLFQA